MKIRYAGFPRLLESPGFFFFEIPGPGKSSKITLVLESPGKISLKIVHEGISVVNFDISSCTKFQISRGSAPEPAGGAYSDPPDSIAGGEGLTAPSARTPHPLTALRASGFLFLYI